MSPNPAKSTACDKVRGITTLSGAKGEFPLSPHLLKSLAWQLASALTRNAHRLTPKARQAGDFLRRDLENLHPSDLEAPVIRVMLLERVEMVEAGLRGGDRRGK